VAAAAAASSVARAPSVRRLTGQKAAVSATFLLWLCKLRPMLAGAHAGWRKFVSSIHSVSTSLSSCY